MDSRKWKIFLVHKILNQQLIKIEKRLQKENKMVEENGEKEKELSVQKKDTNISTAFILAGIFLG